MDICRL